MAKTKLKYEILMGKEYTKEVFGRPVYRIRALRDFDHPSLSVKRGQLGGFVESEANLSHTGTCWIADDAIVSENAKVSGHALVRNKAIVEDYVQITGHASVSGFAVISNSVVIKDNATVDEHAAIDGNVVVFERARITGNTSVHDYATVAGNAYIKGNAVPTGHADVRGNAKVCDSASIHDRVTVQGLARVKGRARIYGKVLVRHNAIVTDDARINATAIIEDDALIGGAMVLTNNGPDYKITIGGEVNIRGSGRISGNATIRNWNHFMMFTNVGSENGILTIYREKVGKGYIRTATRGCFTGSTKDFLEASAKVHMRENKAIHEQYTALINIANSAVKL